MVKSQCFDEFKLILIYICIFIAAGGKEMYFWIKFSVFLSICVSVFLNIKLFSLLLMTYCKPRQAFTIEAGHSGVGVLSLNLPFFGNSFVAQ
jgi:hypothetical protein